MFFEFLCVFMAAIFIFAGIYIIYDGSLTGSSDAIFAYTFLGLLLFAAGSFFIYMAYDHHNF